MASFQHHSEVCILCIFSPNLTIFATLGLKMNENPNFLKIRLHTHKVGQNKEISTYFVKVGDPKKLPYATLVYLVNKGLIPSRQEFFPDLQL